MRADIPRSTAPQSVTRVLQILDALAASDRPVGLAALSRALNTPKSSLAALLRGLVDTHFVTYTEGVYSLGPSAFGLGSALMEARRRTHTSDIIREALRDLSQRCGETVLFAVPNHDGTGTMTYVDIIESRNSIRYSSAIGDRRPLYCTAGGRALLSGRSAEEVRRYLHHANLEKLTPNTETDPKRLLAIIERAREEGVASTYDEAAQGASGAAALIRDASGQVRGALIIAAPTPRLADRSNALAKLVRDAAQAISRNLGYRGEA